MLGKGSSGPPALPDITLNCSHLLCVFHWCLVSLGGWRILGRTYTWPQQLFGKIKAKRKLLSKAAFSSFNVLMSYLGIAKMQILTQ